MRNKTILLTLVLCLLYNECEAKVVHSDSVFIKFVRVEGGDFSLGNTVKHDTLGQNDELPIKNLKLETYYISAYEITNEQWSKVMGEKCSDENKKLPKGNLSYMDCIAFIDSLSSITGKSFRLPTEAEWEYAAKGGINDKHLFIYSGSNDINEVAWYNDTIVHPVGSKKPNKLGLYDMSGNVFEWCSSVYYLYSDSSRANFSDLYVIRGGGFNRESEDCRITRRNGINKTTRKPEYGFRIIYDNDEESVNLLIPESQDKGINPRYLYVSIFFVIIGISAILLFLRNIRKNSKTITYKDSSINHIDEHIKKINGINKREIGIIDSQTQVSPTQSLERNVSSNDKLDRFSIDCDNCLVVGASVRGKGHIQTNLPCQDNHKYTYLNNGWGIAVVSDGAGSASKSQIGSRIVVERATAHFVEVIKKMKWIELNVLPSNEDWAQIAYSVLRRVYGDITDFARTKTIEVKELNATAIVLIHSPLGLLSTHIGDGRAGYRNNDGKWLPLIVPHKGEEANQTIFITSQFWDSPSFCMSGHLIPESRVVKEEITGFTLMSDGCESTSWQVSQMDKDTGKVCDPNEPFQKFYEPLSKTLIQYHNDRVDVDERAEAWYSFLDTGKEFYREVDDKTLILGIIL